MDTSILRESVPEKPEWEHYTLRNAQGMTVSFLNKGGCITSIVPPGGPDVVLRYEDFRDYEENPLYLGAIIGPVAGRIKDATYKYDGHTYNLTKNEGPHHLHGGDAGLHLNLWHVDMKEDCAVLTTECEGDGYPGKMKVEVTYTLTEENELCIEYVAEVTEARPVALTNHTYFNLGDDDISDHTLTMPASSYLELDEELIPTGAALDALDTFDFRKGLRFQDGFGHDHPERRVTGSGYDHFFLLDEPSLTLRSSEGREMKVWTDQSGVQVYTGHNIPEGAGIYGKRSGPFAGVCLETQSHPVSLMSDDFPSIIVEPGSPYRKKTCFWFGDGSRV